MPPHMADRPATGTEAVRWATVAVDGTQHASPSALDTLAVSYADTGQFAEAVTAIKKALASIDAETSHLEPELRARLELFERGEPYREGL